MAGRHGKQRQLYGAAALPMQAERHGEEPSHRRIETMEHPETGKGKPGPGSFYRHFRCAGVAATPVRISWIAVGIR